MKEKKKINLGTCLIIMAVLLVALLVLTYFLVNQMKENQKLKEEANKVEAVNETSEVVENEVNNEVANTVKEEEGKEVYLEGRFTGRVNEYFTDAPDYVFTKDGKVTVEGNDLTKGSYTIENNKVIMKYNYHMSPAETVPDSFYNEQETAEFIDEDHIKIGNTTLEKMHLMTKDEIVGKWHIDYSHKVLGNDNIQYQDTGYGSLGPGVLEIRADGTYNDSIRPESANSEIEKDLRGTYKLNEYVLEFTSESQVFKTCMVYSDKMIYPFTYDGQPLAFILVKD